MQLKSIDSALKKYTPVLNIAGILVIVIAFLMLRNRAKKDYTKSCTEEIKMEFSGKISNYTSNSEKGQAYFMLNDTSGFYTIPRTSKFMYLNDGDSIVKRSGENRYMVNRYGYGTNSLIKKAVDTFDFDCP